jgi:hypothetical protein
MSNKAGSVNEGFMDEDIGSVGNRVDERDDFHFEGKLLLVILDVRVAHCRRLQFDILNPHVRKRILEVGHELSEIVIVGRAAHVEDRGSIRELMIHPDFGLHLTAELRNLNPVVLLE